MASAFQIRFPHPLFLDHKSTVAKAPHALPTKLSRPRLFDPVARERLFARLDKLGKSPLVWVCGPPGSGKTSLISAWLDGRNKPTLWYQVDSGDVEPATSFSFLRQLSPAGRLQRQRLPLFTPDHVSDLPAFARRFFRALYARLPLNGVVVFDNCQEAAAPAFHSLLEQAASQLPSTMTLVAISRDQPPGEFTKLRANQTLSTLGWPELRLTPDESAEILDRHAISDPGIKQNIIERADGWAAGLILLVSTARQHTDAARDLFSREALFTYFAGEVFNNTPAAIQDLLMRTALLPEIDRAAAAQLSDLPDALQLLEELHRRQYFTDRRTEPDLSYHYHDLFRDFLVARASNTYSATHWRAIQLQSAQHMEAREFFESAVSLYERAEAWTEIERLVLSRAEYLMSQGRWPTLRKWIDVLSQAKRASNPWVLYWRGMTEEVADVLRARTTFEHVAQLFAQQKDHNGEALALSAIVDSFFQEWNTVVALDKWLDALLQLLGESAHELSPNNLARAHTSLLIGLVFRRPGDPALRDCVTAVESRAEVETDPSERLRMTVYLILYHDLMGDFSRVRALVARLGTATTNQNIGPRLRVWAIFRIAHHYMNSGDDKQALTQVQEAIQIAQHEGVELLSGFLLICHAMILLNAGQPESAVEPLQRALPLLKSTRPMEVVFYKWAEFSIAMALGKQTQASALWDAFAHVPLIGVAHNLVYNHGTVLLLAQRGRIDEAQKRIDSWREAVAGMNSACLGYNLDLMQAYLHLQRGANAQACDVLRRAFTTAASHGVYGNLCWLPEMMRPLCALAIREGIEPDFVAELIRRKRLTAPLDTISWAWPLRVYTLGRFAVFRDREQIRFAHRPQHRPLELLQAIIAAGAPGAPTKQLANQLWPDSEGDAANNALNAALHRLRKLLGDDVAVIVDGGRVRLNTDVCWVDALAFDTAATKFLADAASGPSPEDVIRLYSGHFLGQDVDAAWCIAFRDRLRAKFQRLVIAVCERMEQQRQWRAAASLYRRALEVDNLQEEVYRRLIVCLRELGEFAEAKNTYRRCRELLSIVLGVSPSRETTAAFESIRG